MEHLQVKAAATTTDQGIFTALAATYSVDRVGDRIEPGAFAKTIKAWQSSDKRIPLHWDHESSADAIIGSVDPKSMRETKEGLYVEGQLDLENSEIAREAWRSMKNNALALSFGYLATKTGKDGDVTTLLEIDLFEISIVPAPANNDTRVLSLKSALETKQQPTVRRDPEVCSMDEPWAVMEGDEAMSCHMTEEEARAAMGEMMGASVEKSAFKSIEDVQAYLEEKFPGHKIVSASEVPAPAKSEDPLRKRTYDVALEVAGGDPTVRCVEPEPVPEPEPLDAVALRRQSERAALDIALG